MSQISQYFIKNAERNILKKVVMVVYVAVSSPLWIVPLVISLHMAKGSSLAYFAVVVGAGTLGFSWWYSGITAHFMSAENQPFRLAVLSTFLPVFVTLSFVPMIGIAFERIVSYQRRRNPFVENLSQSE